MLTTAIDATHDTALSTACGGYLDSIVVETAQGGAACVEFLRANNLGR
jgi:structural maintenance of chromosome 4